jgi:hypothetical protein
MPWQHQRPIIIFRKKTNFHRNYYFSPKSALVKLNQYLFFLSFLLSVTVVAQKKEASVKGRVLDAGELPLAGVSVVILGSKKAVPPPIPERSA